MKKYIAAITTVIALSATNALANEGFEKCKIIKDGKGLIKANKADCAGKTHACAGQNKGGDPESWILVPKGQCEKINAGEFSGIDKAIKDKIEESK